MTRSESIGRWWGVATFEEAVDGVGGGWNSEIVVVDKGDGVDNGGEEWVDSVFVGETRCKFGLRVDLNKSYRGF